MQTHIETYYWITTAYFLNWYRTIKEKMWVKPGEMACVTLRFMRGNR